MPAYLSNRTIAMLTCRTCLAGRQIRWRSCPECNGRLFGFIARDTLYYWGERISFPLMRLVYLQRVWNIIIEIACAVAAVLSFVFAAYIALHFPVAYYTYPAFWITTPRLSLWIGVGLLCSAYVIARIMRARRARRTIPMHKLWEEEQLAEHAPDWVEAKKWSGAHAVSIAEMFDADAMHAVRRAFFIARERCAAEVGVVHMFAALLEFSAVESIFIRLGITKDMIVDKLHLAGVSPPECHLDTVPFSLDVQETLLQAFEEAYMQREDEVGLSDMLIAVVRQDRALQDVLYGLDIEAQKLANVVAWVRVGEMLADYRRRRHHAAAHVPRGDTNRAMTALATPFLNRFSLDLSKENLRGVLPVTIGREKELEELFRVIEGGGKSVLLVGEEGAGKSSIINAVAELMLENNVPDPLKDKRLVRLSVPALLAGGTAAIAFERLENIFNEVARSKNIVLVIESVEDLSGVSSGGEQSLDVSEALAQELQKGYFFTIATATPEAHRRFIASTALDGVLQRIDVAPLSVDETVRVLEAKAGALEYKHSVWFSYASLYAAARLAGRYLTDQALPAPAIEIISEAGHLARRTKGKNCFVTDQDVAAIIAARTTIPVTAITENESQRLLRLEAEMHQRVVGQDTAVSHVANALRRARTELRSEHRPIANFLFVGPTGVGKTELAKTISMVYFGAEDNMVRLDMSEYQDVSAIERIIGVPGKQGTGVLTEAIRKRPFTVLLLDELEKANTDVLNLFLQVMDDGRLTDSVGRTVDFSNVILIATSNAGTRFVQEQMEHHVLLADIEESMRRRVLLESFKPEFLNRFTAVVLFKPLTQDELVVIARLMTGRIIRTLDERGIQLVFTDDAIRELAVAGYDPEYGARPLRRVIENNVENKIASLLLEGKLRRSMTVTYGAGGSLTVTGGEISPTPR